MFQFVSFHRFYRIKSILTIKAPEFDLLPRLMLLSILCFLFAISTAYGTNQPATVVKPILVNVAKVRPGNVTNTVNALGSLSAVQVVAASSVSDGRISRVYFKNGQVVKKGVLIVQLDNTQAKVDYQSAVTALQLSRLKYQRSKLVPTAISKQELAKLKADVDSKEANVKTKQVALNQKQITAPFSGVLGNFQVQVGDYLKAGAPIVTLVNIKKLRADYQLPESQLPKLKRGQSVKITTSAYPNKAFYGRVIFISPTVNKDTRSVLVQALIMNDKNILAPGMFVNASQEVSVSTNVPMIPEEAVLADVKGYYVYTVVGHKVAKIYLETGVRTNNEVQAVSGLKPGDVVVTAGQQKLQDGSIIQIAPKNTIQGQN